MVGISMVIVYGRPQSDRGCWVGWALLTWGLTRVNAALGFTPFTFLQAIGVLQV